MPIVLLLLVLVIALALYLDRGAGDRTKQERSADQESHPIASDTLSIFNQSTFQ